jgi:hypothetical protein
MITTGTTALMLTMSLLAAGPSVAVKVFADTTVIQASDQNTEQSNAAQIDQQSDGDGVQLGSIDQTNNAVNLDRQEVGIIDNNNDNTILQLSDQNTEQSNAAQIDQQSDGDGVQLGSISQENNAVNDHKQDLVWCVFNPVTLEEICPPPR